MKVAVLFSVPETTSTNDCWRWRSIDGKFDSTHAFRNYEECLNDAIANGYLYHFPIQDNKAPTPQANARSK
jgi:hypothetical protein